ERIEVIETVHSAGRQEGEGASPAAPAARGRSLAEVARQRRSALDFTGGARRIGIDQLEALLGWARQPFSADWEGRFVRLWLYVHRVEGLAPGIYDDGLRMVREGDQRVAAAGLSLGQDLAGNACVAFSMVADLERITDLYRDRGYRMAHWEAGMIGQRMYLAATAMGFGATGIGAFFDDRVRGYLGFEQGEVVYHYACGYPVVDPRLAG
ncbi:MAG TPA: SagB/ThcOx family dehydrogenase, partial [Bryobacteraceae bacterium]|nr:SagB/ThcOx family dehydrogenase [Bryobacteraceae bacterium]